MNRPNAVLRKDVGARIRTARASKGMTQEDLAAAIEIAPESFGRIERGRSFPSIPTLIRLSQVLGISIDDLLCNTPPISKPSHTKPEIRRLICILERLDNKTLRHVVSTVRMMTRGRPSGRARS